ncbi:MAG TPA: NAD(P)-dependent oxidoreductase [Stellaceae bacterium]|nr:NAD(P)-dependent oxidoreductase [Stellaceae bacterium]
MMASLVVTFDAEARLRALVEAAVADQAQVIWLADLDAPARAEALRGAGAVMARHTNELKPDERKLLTSARLLQMTTAGVDYIPFGDLPPGLPIAQNAGPFSDAIAEHAVAMALAAAKRLFIEHNNLKNGAFNQFTRNRMLAGGVCGIFGFGAIGVATARRMRALGMRVHAINRRGASDEPVDWIGTPDRLDELLTVSDVLVIGAALTRATLGAIGARELALMKTDAILVNLARGEIIDEAAFYAHLVAHKGFTACIDAWWTEPLRHGVFRLDHPFLDLPNVIGSPHNSAMVPGLYDEVLRHAVANCLVALAGGAPARLVRPEERLA